MLRSREAGRCGFCERRIGSRPDAAPTYERQAAGMLSSPATRVGDQWSGPANGRRVVVIDDEVSISEPLRSSLVREGFRVKVAATSSQGLALIEGEAPELVLLDLMLPDMDGRDVCRSIAGTPRLAGATSPRITTASLVKDHAAWGTANSPDRMKRGMAGPP